MLKPQDCVVLIKLIAKDAVEVSCSQRQLALELCMSQSEVSESIKRLRSAGLVGMPDSPILAAVEEYLIHGVKYAFPVSLGEYTRGIATAIAAPVFKGKVVMGDDPIPVWPYGKGDAQGVALAPLYRSVPHSIQEHPDPTFYDLLALVDIIRQGRARERKIAIQLLQERLHYEK